MGAISLHARPSATFAQKLENSKALLRAAALQYLPMTQASSLGAEDMVISHLVAETGIACSIFVLDTRMLHAQTLALVAQLQERYSLTVDVYRPDTAVAENFVTEFGEDAMYKSLELRKACCGFRKMEPLERALAGKKSWITGLRREQSDARADVHDIEIQSLIVDGKAVNRTKVNPLVEWTWGDVWHFISLNNVPYNALHDEFFPSIGCAPCTRAVTLGEDFRSGRWWWEQQSAKECGLHVSDADAAPEGKAAAGAGAVPGLEPVAFESVSRTSSFVSFSSLSSIPIKEIKA